MQQAAQLLRNFYQTLEGKGALPLEPDDPYYVPILSTDPVRDPILRLWQRIDLATSESVHLLTGFRGNGKSTELRRLKRLLEQSGCVVFLVNMLDYLLITKPVELSDFTLSLMAAFSNAAGEAEELNLNPLASSYWERLTDFLRQTEVEIEKLGLKNGAADLGLKLKTEPDFKEQVQRHLRGHLSRLTKDAQQFADALVVQIRKASNDPNKKVILLVDSVEQLRGQGDDAAKVHTSVVELFSGQAPHLAFPKLHVVYTVPPFLMAMSPNLGRNLGGHAIAQWPNIHVRKKDGSPDPDGIRVMEEIISRRCPNWRQIFTPEDLARLAHISGGDVRDFFRLIRECLVSLMIGGEQAHGRVGQDLLDRAVLILRNEMLPLADADASRLAMIHTSKREELASVNDLPTLARYLDTNIIMNYLNGEPWYDIHPVLIEELRKRGLITAIA